MVSKSQVKVKKNIFCLSMEEILKNHKSIVKNQSYTKAFKNQSIYNTFIKLVNVYLQTHEEYPFKRYNFEYKYHIVPIGNYEGDVIMDENIKNFLLDNGIKNDKDFVSFREKVYRHYYIVPAVMITTAREKQLDEKMKIKKCLII